MTTAHGLIYCSNPECDADPFDASVFNNLDLPFDENNPLCPDCSEKRQLGNEICEHCDRPARHYYGSETLCDKCYNDAMEHEH